MKNSFIILFVIISLQLFAQNDTVFIRKMDSYKKDYVTDTIIFSNEMYRTVLTGTTILPMSYNQLDVQGYDIHLMKVKSTDCDNRSNELSSGAHIKKVLFTDSSMVIKTTIYSNCCFNFLCDVGVENDSTLNLIYYEYGATHCACNCCFCLDYHLSIGTMLGKENTMKFIIINDNTKSLYDILRNQYIENN